MGIERIENALMFSLKKDLPVAIVSSLEGLSLFLSLHHHPSTAFLLGLSRLSVGWECGQSDVTWFGISTM